MKAELKSAITRDLTELDRLLNATSRYPGRQMQIKETMARLWRLWLRVLDGD